MWRKTSKEGIEPRIEAENFSLSKRESRKNFSFMFVLGVTIKFELIKWAFLPWERWEQEEASTGWTFCVDE